MSHTLTRILIGITALVVLAIGSYGISHRVDPSLLANELQTFALMSLLFLWPFAILAKNAKPKFANFSLLVAAIVMSSLDSWLLLNDMVLSSDPTWGFSIITVAVANAIIFGITTLIFKAILGASNQVSENGT